jgi:hypothetical protein
MRRHDLRPLRRAGQELVHLFQGAVVCGDHEAVVVHVQDQVLAHHGQAHHANVSNRFHVS